LNDPSHSTLIENKASQFSIETKKLELIANKICILLGVSHLELGIRFVDSDEIQNLNLSFRNIDKPTDVLSFPQMEWETPLEASQNETPVDSKTSQPGPPQALGDIVICPNIANDNAININQTLDREICFLLVHGILHLCGHDHEEKSEEIVMLKQQKVIMASLADLSDEDSSIPIWADCLSAGRSDHV